MSYPELVMSSPDQPLPISALREPFAVLLDVRDAEWADSFWVNCKAAELLDAGCRYFVCFGPKSESVHDLIDDVVLNHGGDSVPTTFHDDETVEDVANFFKIVVMSGMAHGLLLVRDFVDWEKPV